MKVKQIKKNIFNSNSSIKFWNFKSGLQFFY